MAHAAVGRLAVPLASPELLRATSNRSASTSCCSAAYALPSSSGGAALKRNRAGLSFLGQGVVRGFEAQAGGVRMALAVHHEGDPSTVNPTGLHETMLDNVSASEVFHDEDKGITCYETPLGEIVCEGIDDGPHFSSKELPQAKRMVGALHSGLDQVKARAMKVRRALRDNEPLEGAMCVTDSEGHVECDGLDESHVCM
ncbi:hypothetical protein KFL_001050270 [Klebsormidium nitens]|uniref:Uncharacterized protein n=1 Tax=Klebsormidium nitens TaxID=105231 RepID=A0A1Y1HUG6_KLENI|nr:hypothetical protein KFL_001050270 [Klebsormidium nitens]|eukprot:GAQ82264.1 hypothetical protein KFL_001050270 [Klebsormidium nitens]